MTTRTLRHLTFGLILLLALGVLAAPVLAQKGKGGGGGGGGGGSGGLPANPNVAYASKGGALTLMDTVTGETGTLDSSGRYPAWSPDGSQIAYRTGQPYDIVIRNTDGSGAAQYVTTTTQLGTGGIDWSRAPTPNGQHMLIYTDEDQAGYTKVYAVGTDGSGHVALADDAMLWWDGPRWSPTGNQFVYKSNSFNYGQMVICNVGVNGTSGLLEVTGAPIPIPHPTGFEYDWSNDGNWLVVQISNDLWIVDTQALATAYQLTFTPNEQERSPSFDASDTRIFFTIDDKDDRLYSIDALTGGTPVLESGGTKGIFGPRCRRN